MDPFVLVIFGLTSNLAQIKLIPALYDLEEKGILVPGTKIIGTARRPLSQQELESYIDATLRTQNHHHTHAIKEETLKKLCHKINYLNGDLDDPIFYCKLKDHLTKLSQKEANSHNRIFYLATYPNLYATIFQNLKKSQITEQKPGWSRLIIEKPIGTDEKSARELNHLLLKYFKEEQIYRLDHYLGKETLQNILTFRFGNDVFEPLMNNQYIDHIQITAAEDFGIGKRGAYYDTVGALKDVGQNHLLQMLVFATMDAPTQFTNEAITKERIKILKKLIPQPKKIVLGQYQGYLQEENINPKSFTDTFFALKTEIDNERFKGVPVYIRAGKKLTRTATEITIVFKNPINRLLKHLDCGDEPNILTYRIQPNEGIVLKILTKKPGYKINLEPQYMQFCYHQDSHSHYIPDAYERLLVDALEGEQTFFNDAAEVEAEWTFVEPLTKKIAKPYIYKPGSWGPKEADKLIEVDGRSWLEPSVDFCKF